MAEVITISDAQDPRIAAFSAIRERDLVGREGRFIAEGTVVLRMLLAAHHANAGIRAEALLLLENRVAGLAPLLEEWPDDLPVYVASAAVLDAIAGFHLHRGVLALGSRLTAPCASDLIAGLPEKALVLVGCGISNHDNVGSMFRNAAGFSADAVLLDETSCDPLYRKALRVSVGSVLSVPYAREQSGIALLSALDAAGFMVAALTPSGQTEIGAIASGLKDRQRLALVVGTEGEGLPPEVLARFMTVRIAQSSRLDSLNLGTASGIALHCAALALGKLG
ncbi:TrmH family RNA methyltransferase [Allorhizobium taibaishanense]|uniref:RNA methyltransferase n=1 Tax=Allorhizobium taibaishanense TaxID=887144 RepID=A0A1Q9A4M4_9HYPH|nr:RNA methyltransferase [Allorhizobium taibaishanense]MBB4006571.1 tRNA G18 (ribose-2'-O)-methylase SpoU [Allorhizobium taibaishanense]OLP49496.1 RNA methyltransferase [Allorhizobium taibaishanense]